MAAGSSTLCFPVHVGEPELLTPEIPTPHEFKYLSSLDNQFDLRNHMPFVHFYRRRPSSGQDDPVPVIRRALRRTLVHYYPLAGRLRSDEKERLVVECTGEGVVFREADAEVSLARLRPADGPPFPWWPQLLVDDVFGCSSITDSPLLRVQVTRLACGGFALAYTVNHCICDAYGVLQFITAVAEMARHPSLPGPSLIPVWGRENLAPRQPPRVSFCHPAYVADSSAPPDAAEFLPLAQTSCFFSRADVSALKSRIGRGGGNRRKYLSTFDAVAACLWCARVRALGLSGNARLLIPSDIRFQHRPALGKGYYGVGTVTLCVSVPTAVLQWRLLGSTAEMISAEKALVSSEEYRASAVDFLETEGRRRGFGRAPDDFGVSDMSRLPFADVDVGWGAAEYGGAARPGMGPVPGLLALLVGNRRRGTGEAGAEAEQGLLALLMLPSEAVDAFHKEVTCMVKGEDADYDYKMDDSFLRSAL